MITNEMGYDYKSVHFRKSKKKLDCINAILQLYVLNNAYSIEKKINLYFQAILEWRMQILKKRYEKEGKIGKHLLQK